jgi:hypothetical protein
MWSVYHAHSETSEKRDAADEKEDAGQNGRYADADG